MSQKHASGLAACVVTGETVVVMTMLLLLLCIMTVIMLVCMGMSVVQVRAEQKSKAGIVWMALSCFSIFMVVGISYLMIKAPVSSGETVSLSQEIASPATKDKTTETAASVSPNQASSDDSLEALKALSSYSYLIDILDALKKGEPIPEKYLEMLPESVRKQIVESQQKAAGQKGGNTSQGGSTQPAFAVVINSAKQGTSPAGSNNSQPASSAGNNTNQSQTPAGTGGYKSPTQSQQSSQQPPSQQPPAQQSSGQQSPAQEPATSAPPVSQPNPTVSTKPALSAASWIAQVLYQDRAVVRNKLQNALPLQQSTDKDLYMTGEMILEVRYADDRAVSIIMVMERLSPEGQSRDYWESQFRQKAGMDDSAPTMREGLVTAWDGVYAGVTNIQFVIDLDINRGLIQAW